MPPSERPLPFESAVSEMFGAVATILSPSARNALGAEIIPRDLSSIAIFAVCVVRPNVLVHTMWKWRPRRRGIDANVAVPFHVDTSSASVGCHLPRVVSHVLFTCMRTPHVPHQSGAPGWKPICLMVHTPTIHVAR